MPDERVSGLDSLAERMSSGDEKAYRAFADAFGPQFQAYFRRRGLSDADAEALAVSCITDAALAIRKFSYEGPGSLQRWAFTIAHNKLVDWARGQQYMFSLNEVSCYPDEDTSTSWSNESVVAAACEALNELSEVDHNIVCLRLLKQPYPFAEIGEMLDLTETAVRVRHHRALMRLRKILEKNPACIELLSSSQQKRSQDDGHG